jgi:hypothetical protein
LQCPKQKNSFDCGVYTILFLNWIIEMKPISTKDHIINCFFDYFNESTFPLPVVFEEFRDQLKNQIIR